MEYAMESGHTPTSNGHSAHEHNVGKADRVISALLGAQTLLRIGRWHGWRKAVAATGGIMLITRAATGHSKVYETLGVSSAGLAEQAGIDLSASIIIARPRNELFEFWRDAANLPLVMRHLVSVVETGNGVTHWVARGLQGAGIEWDARMIDEEPDELLAWQSLPGGDIEHAGSVRLEDAGDAGTGLTVTMRYRPHGREAGAAWFLEPVTHADLTEDLARLKEVMETGVDIATEGQPSGQEDR